MCGFLCAICFEGEIGEEEFFNLKGLNNLLKHRGPDDEGYYISEDRKLFFSHGRLSILDLSKAGHQPMLSDDKRFVIVFNGEIYNFKELRERLKGKYNFFSNSDTEVLLKLYMEYGEKIFKLLDGMYAFLIFDKKENKLFVGRDILGQKPLYYTFWGKRIIFSSEIKPILKIKGDITLSKAGLFNYFLYGSTVGSNSIFKEIKKFPPSSYALINLNRISPNLKIENYLKKISFNESESLKDQILNSVKRRLISDVKVGTMLSGGIDSSIVTISAANFTKNIDTYTVVFEKGNELYDESERVKRVVERTGLKNWILEMDYSIFKKNLLSNINFFEEPVNNPVWISIFLISKFAREKGTKVLLSGDGGDEIFFGYRRWLLYYKLLKFYSFFNFVPNGKINEEFNYRKKVGLPLFTGKVNFKLIDLKKILNEESFKLESFLDFIEEKKVTFKKIFPEGRLDQWMSFISLRTNFIEDFLMRNDKMGMANSLEIRSPLLNRDIFFRGISLSRKDRFSLSSGKIYLKEILKKEMGKEFVNLKKIGFCAPIKLWEKDYLSSDWVRKLVKINKSEGIFRDNFLKNLEQNIKKLKPFQIFTMYFFVKWYEKWIEK